MAQAASFFTCLLQEFSGNSALGLAHHTLEEMAATGGREVARLLLQGCLDLRAEREEKAPATLAPTARTRIGRGRGRLERGHHRALATVVGTVQVTRCALRAPGRVAVHPADAALALPRERHSMGLRRLAVLESVRGSYDAALEGIDRVCGTRLCGKRQLEHLVRQAAVDVVSFYAVRTPEPATASTLLVMSVDGKGIVMRLGHLRPDTARAAERAKRTFRTRLASGEEANRKRMATLACVYDAEPAERRLHDVISPPGGRTGDRTPRPGPKATAKWLCGSVSEDADEVVARAFDEAESRDPAPSVTGLSWSTAPATSWNSSRPRPPAAASTSTSFWTSCTSWRNSGPPAASTPPPTPPPRTGLRSKPPVSSPAPLPPPPDLRAEADERHLTEDERTAVDKAADYLDGYQDFLLYDQALRAGWPIGSGVIEGAARHLVADRLDITGSRWSVPGAEALLLLRAVTSNHGFDAYWQHHLNAERQRVHPHADQRTVPLTA